MLNLLSFAPMFGMVVKLDELLSVLETTIIFVALGLIVFAIAFLIVVLVTPFSVKKEIEDDLVQGWVVVGKLRNRILNPRSYPFTRQERACGPHSTRRLSGDMAHTERARSSRA